MLAEAGGLTKQRFLTIWLLGSGVTGLLIGLTTALLHTPWMMPLFVFLGALGLTILFVRVWQSSSQHGRVPPTITRGTAILLLLLSGLFLALFGGVLVIGAATAPPVCVCLDATSWLTWAALVFEGALFTGMLAPLLCGVVVALRRFAQRADA